MSKKIIKEYKNHKEVPKQYRWDLEDLLKGSEIKDLIAQFFKLYDEEIKIKDSKYNSLEEFYQACKLNEKISLLSNRIQNYISNSISINVIDSKMHAIEESLSFKLNQYSQRLGSGINRIFKHEKAIREYLKDDRLKDYRKDYEAIFESKKHKLSDEIEEFLISISRANVSPYDVFSILSNSELVFKKVIGSDGKEYEMSEGMRLSLAQNKDPQVRKQAYWSYIDAYFQHRNSFARLLFDEFKKTTTWAKVRKYDSAIHSLLEDDKVKPKLLHTLYKVCKKNRHIFQRHYELRKKFFKAKFKTEMQRWDGNLPLVDQKQTYTIEEAQKIVIESIKPLGNEYAKVASDGLLKEHWVDYMPVKNKRSGAYSIGGSYGIDKKYILMNFDGTLRSVETLAHELGHSMHSYFSDTNQSIAAASYPIFLAEIASIFNELMLSDYLLENSKDLEFQYHILHTLIENFEGTVMRQIEWSNFEFKMYDLIEKGEPLTTYDAISDLYYKNAKEYARAFPIEKDPKLLLYSVMVPHYYYDFYVYKYAIGQICANIFFEKYKTEGPKALQQYINKFLKQGGSKWPLEILKDSGIDLYDSSVYELAFKGVEKKISKLEKIGNKIFKKIKIN